MAGTACTVTAIPPTTADRNREQVVKLENEVDQLRRRTQELESALAAADGKGLLRLDGQPLDPAVLAAAPLATSLELGRFGGPVDTDGDGAPDLLRLYLRPLDGRGETVQVAGSASVEVLWLDGAGVSRSVGALRLDPAAWRDSLRSGFMGTHYTVEVPLDIPTGADTRGGSMIARISVRDGLTGRTLATESLHTLPGPVGPTSP